MQDAGIMLGHHLKESWAFIYRDGSGVGGRKEVYLRAMKPADVFFKGTLICVSFFLCLWFLVHFLVACVGGTVPNIIFFPFWGAIKAQRRARVGDMVGRSTWGKVPTAISHFSTCCSQDFTFGSYCIALTCVSAGQSKVELSSASCSQKRTWKGIACLHKLCWTDILFTKVIFTALFALNAIDIVNRIEYIHQYLKPNKNKNSYLTGLNPPLLLIVVKVFILVIPIYVHVLVLICTFVKGILFFQIFLYLMSGQLKSHPQTG